MHQKREKNVLTDKQNRKAATSTFHGEEKGNNLSIVFDNCSGSIAEMLLKF
jgi:hypothetical protein